MSGGTMTALPKGAGAVMQARHEAIDSLDLFPTPPFATRAFVERLFAAGYFRDKIVWDPCAGLDHMSDVLAEYAPEVIRSDVFDYGRGHLIGSFIGEGPDVIAPPRPADWIIGNPPFNEALPFVQRALTIARVGVAMLLRTGWVASEGRYAGLFQHRRPHLIAQYVERVPMVKGRWDPDAGTATEYAWFIWWTGEPSPRYSPFEWIAPGCRGQYSRADDIARFAGRMVGVELAPLPMFEGAGGARERQRGNAGK